MVNLLLYITKKDKNGYYTKKILETKSNVTILNTGVAVRILDSKLSKKLEECLNGDDLKMKLGGLESETKDLKESLGSFKIINERLKRVEETLGNMLGW